MAAFSDADKERIRYHLNYPNVAVGAMLFGGTMFTKQPQYILEFNLNNILPEAMARVQTILTTLDLIELQMVDALARLQAAKADVVTLNPHEHEDLQGQYIYWQGRLAKQLSVPVNPMSVGGGMNGLNARLGGR